MTDWLLFIFAATGAAAWTLGAAYAMAVLAYTFFDSSFGRRHFSSIRLHDEFRWTAISYRKPSPSRIRVLMLSLPGLRRGVVIGLSGKQHCFEVEERTAS